MTVLVSLLSSKTAQQVEKRQSNEREHNELALCTSRVPCSSVKLVKFSVKKNKESFLPHICCVYSSSFVRLEENSEKVDIRFINI